MPQAINIEIFDVTEDGFPAVADGGVCFLWNRDVYTGWPLIDADNSYPGNRDFATPEQARANPLNVRWEASEDRVSGLFSEVRFWFRKPEAALKGEGE